MIQVNEFKNLVNFNKQESWTRSRFLLEEDSYVCVFFVVVGGLF